MSGWRYPRTAHHHWGKEPNDDMDMTAKGVIAIVGAGAVIAAGVGVGLMLADSTFETSGVVVAAGECDLSTSSIALQVFASDNELLGVGHLDRPYYRGHRDECEWIFRIPDIETDRGPYRLEFRGFDFLFNESLAKTIRLRMEGNQVEQAKELR